jgi:glucokinase
MAGSNFPRLLGDIGGTNARFARQLSADAALQDVASYRGAEFASLQDVMLRYCVDGGFAMPPWCAIGIANPVIGDRVQMTNHSWHFSIADMQRSLGLRRLLVINDFTALALSLPALQPSDLRQVGGGQAMSGTAIGLVGPGTGLGVSGLLPGLHGSAMVPVMGEGGHATLGAADEQEDAVIGVLRRRFGHASAERAVSGPGLINLYLALAELRGVSAPAMEARDIAQAALQGGDELCTAALGMFCALLGGVAGNVALTLGARGGVYIGGGIVPQLGEWLDRSRFRERFESKGRLRGYLEVIPTFVVQADVSPALLGATRALDEL